MTRPLETPGSAGSRRTRAIGGGVGAVALVIVALAGCGSSGGSRSERPAGTPAARSCDGSASLCGRRLDEVVFPGTHNSYAASEEPGWHFANQRYGIGRQLDDGIRALLIDVLRGG